jgi:hypothetical protein
MKYKVGDRVRIKSIDWYNENKDKDGLVIVEPSTHVFIPEMLEHCGKIVTIKNVFEDNNCKAVYYMKEIDWDWTDEMIEGLVEEENTLSKNAKLVSERFAEYVNPSEFKHSQDTIMKMLLQGAINLPQGYQFKDENGNVINATKIVLEKKKKEYPKTLKECRRMLDIDSGCLLVSYDLELWKDELLGSLQKLLICRDAYWKIAGEEMGLGKQWEPDWTNQESPKYCIAYVESKIKTAERNIINTILSFPTAEMRDAFYENFKELIENCKELL